MNNPRKKPRQNKAPGVIRIIGGQWRSRKLAVPDLDGLRPTTDRIRETLFSWLLPYVAESRCLDVCAGSGGLGFEALSRGAARVDFVEKNPVAVKYLLENAAALGVKEGVDASVDRRSILDFLKNNADKTQYDIIFVDPPFDLNMHDDIFKALVEGEWLAEDAVIYCEKPRFSELALPNDWYWLKEKSSKNLEFGLLSF